jgi:hypothetical protein
MNPKLIAIAVAVILTVAVLPGYTCKDDVEARQRRCASVLDRSTSGRWESRALNAERKRNCGS